MKLNAMLMHKMADQYQHEAGPPRKVPPNQAGQKEEHPIESLGEQELIEHTNKVKGGFLRVFNQWQTENDHACNLAGPLKNKVDAINAVDVFNEDGVVGCESNRLKTDLVPKIRAAWEEFKKVFDKPYPKE